MSWGLVEGEKQTAVDGMLIAHLIHLPHCHWSQRAVAVLPACHDCCWSLALVSLSFYPHLNGGFVAMGIAASGPSQAHRSACFDPSTWVSCLALAAKMALGHCQVYDWVPQIEDQSMASLRLSQRGDVAHCHQRLAAVEELWPTALPVNQVRVSTWRSAHETTFAQLTARSPMMLNGVMVPALPLTLAPGALVPDPSV